MTFINKHERAIILALCALAMLRIFFFSAAFPFFNNVDEEFHLDVVIKYAKGYLPRKDSSYFDKESAEFMVLYDTLEYEEDYGESNPPPPIWTIIKSPRLSKYVDEAKNYWVTTENHEAFSLPSYYAIAGMWYNLGKLLGLAGGHLLYWIRFLNIGIYGLLIWFSYIFCKEVYKDNISIRIGVPLLLTFFPQDSFYSINSDVLSPLFFLISLYLLIQIYINNRNRLFHFMAGIMVAATFLIKLSNLPLLIIFSIFLLLWAAKLYAAGQFRDRLPNILILSVSFAIPVFFWFGWNAYALGDITGSAEKIKLLGWTVKPFMELWDHPIFTLRGSAYFISNLIETFWRGEFIWGFKRIASERMDLFYVISSGIFIFASLIGPLIFKDYYTSSHRRHNYLNMSILLLYVLFMAVLSISYDFGLYWYPSREYPYFTSGRLISGALIPFLILYVDGLCLIISKISKRINPLVIIAFIALLITYSEIHITYKVLGSPYNWFHMNSTPG